MRSTGKRSPNTTNLAQRTQARETALAGWLAQVFRQNAVEIEELGPADADTQYRWSESLSRYSGSLPDGARSSPSESDP